MIEIKEVKDLYSNGYNPSNSGEQIVVERDVMSALQNGKKVVFNDKRQVVSIDNITNEIKDIVSFP